MKQYLEHQEARHLQPGDRFDLEVGSASRFGVVTYEVTTRKYTGNDPAGDYFYAMQLGRSDIEILCCFWDLSGKVKFYREVAQSSQP